MDNDVNTAAMVHYTGISHDDLNFHWVSTNRVMNHRGGIDIVIHFSEKKRSISIVAKFVVLYFFLSLQKHVACTIESVLK